MEKIKDVVDSFSNRVSEFDSELKRLTKIEERLDAEIVTHLEEIRGLEKALNYSSMPYEAKCLLETELIKVKRNVNELCSFLGRSEKFTNLK